MRSDVALVRLGGCATAGELRRWVSRSAVQQGLRSGQIVRPARGRYALPLVSEHRRQAHALTATLSHLSAAAVHGWPVKTPPDRAWVTVRRKRHLDPALRAGLIVVWRDLAPDDVADGVTTPVRTVVDCAARLPFDEALAVADSALRAGSVRPQELRDAAAVLRGIGSPEARRVVAEADARAANPFESVLRAVCLDVPGLDVRPQVQVTGDGIWAVVDLADERRRLVVEAEGFAHHGGRRDLVRDCRRFTELAVLGWSVLRLTWEDVVLRPDRVRWALSAWLEQREGRSVPPPPTGGQAPRAF